MPLWASFISNYWISGCSSWCWVDAWKSIRAGVLQGSSHCPLLFLLFINGIVTDTRSNIRLFCWWYQLVYNTCSVNTWKPRYRCWTSQSGSWKNMTWAKTWLICFNPKKTESLLNKSVHPPLLMDNQVIIEVDAHKHLGVFHSNDCTWHIILIMLRKNPGVE